MKWIIVFYQIIVALPEGEIVFSGLNLGNKFVKTEFILQNSYVSKNECEENLVRFKGKNKVQQHQMVYKALKGKMDSDLHALSISTEEK